MKNASLSEVKTRLSRFLRLAQRDPILITRRGKPAGVLIGFKVEDDWLDYLLETDPEFSNRIERARRSIREGKGIRIEDLTRES